MAQGGGAEGRWGPKGGGGRRAAGAGSGRRAEGVLQPPFAQPETWEPKRAGGGSRSTAPRPGLGSGWREGGRSRALGGPNPSPPSACGACRGSREGRERQRLSPLPPAWSSQRREQRITERVRPSAKGNVRASWGFSGHLSGGCSGAGRPRRSLSLCFPALFSPQDRFSRAREQRRKKRPAAQQQAGAGGVGGSGGSLYTTGRAAVKQDFFGLVSPFLIALLFGGLQPAPCFTALRCPWQYGL